jgi:hypothetical protein
MFAADGAMQTSFTAFSSAVALGWGEIETGINDTVAVMNEDLPAAIALFDTNKDPFLASLTTVKDALAAAKAEADGLKSSIDGLLALDSTMNVTITVTANETDGSHKTGLMEVPYDGYIAELHKGEMVLTATEAANYRDADISPAAALPATQGQGTTVYNQQVTIQGNNSVDQMIYEFKRRGIDLTKRGK